MKKSDKVKLDAELLEASGQLDKALSPLDSKVGVPVSVSPIMIDAGLKSEIAAPADLPDAAGAPKPIFDKRRFTLRLISAAAAVALIVTGIYFAVRNPVVSEQTDIAGNSSSAESFLADESDGDASTPESITAPSPSSVTSTVPTPLSKTKPSVDGSISSGDYSKVYQKLKALETKSTKESGGILSWIFGGARADSKSTSQAAAEYDSADGGATNGSARQETALELDEDTTAGDNAAGKSDEIGSTNEQVEGVNEADILKNDGLYLYHLRTDVVTEKQLLEIIELTKNGGMTRLSAIDISAADKNFHAGELYISGKYLVLVGTETTENTSSASSATKQGATADIAVDDMYRGGYYGGYGDTKIVLYNIENRKSVKRIREFKQQGGLISTRMIGNHLYTISSYQASSDKPLTEKTVTEYVPKVSDKSGKMVPVPAGDIAIMPEIRDTYYTVATAMDITDAEAVSRLAVLGGGSTVYASLENIFVVGYNYSNNATTTDIMRFKVDKAQISVSAKGNVKGTIYSQFAMDEHNKHFRIATTDFGAQGSTNNVYVLDSELKMVGKVEGLAKGEQIRSVRFMGNMVYVVTFRQVDPLFTIDLSKPATPVVKSELKIPGFSSYMHPVDDNTLIGIGTDGDENGRTFGIKLSLFDVSDPNNVKESHVKTFGKDGSYSTAWNDHKAVTYIKSKGILIIPAWIMDNEYSGQYSFNGFLVVKVDKSSGFTQLAKVTNYTPNAENPGQYVYCGYLENTRSTYVGNIMYAVSGNNIISVAMDNFKTLSSLDYFSVEAYKAKISEYYKAWGYSSSADVDPPENYYLSCINQFKSNDTIAAPPLKSFNGLLNK